MKSSPDTIPFAFDLCRLLPDSIAAMKSRTHNPHTAVVGFLGATFARPGQFHGRFTAVKEITT